MSDTLKGEVAYFMQRLYDENLTTTSGGNISCRTPKGTILLTPSKLDKARLEARQILEMDESGNNLTPHLSASMESSMHLTIYQKYPDIHAIIHAHPLMATAFTAMNQPIHTNLIAEARVILGVPVNAPYAIMGSSELAENVSVAAGKSAVILLDNHGVVTTGKSLLEAFDRIEVLESAAKMTFITQSLNDKRELTDKQLRALDDLL